MRRASLAPSRPWFSYNGSQIAQGRDGAKEALRTNPELYAEIEAKVRAKMDGTAE